MPLPPLVKPARAWPATFVLGMLLAVMLVSAEVRAQDALQPAAAGIGPSTGLPLPRFVSLGTDEANIRTGPGARFPIEWVFVRRGMPIEVIAEYDNWRHVRDWDGAGGWIHRSLLSSRRGFVVLGDVALPLTADTGPEGAAVALVEPGVIGGLLSCPGSTLAEDVAADSVAAEADDRCYVDIAGRRGWLPRAMLWGVYPDEIVE